MEDAAETPKPHDGEALQKEGSKWIERIRASEKREKDWRKDAASAEKAYAADANQTDGTLYDFNILHSNVETIVPAIFNSTPIPDVRRRWVEALGDPPEDPSPQIEQQAQQMQQQGIQPSPQQMQQAQQMLAEYQRAATEFQKKSQIDKDAKSVGDLIERTITVQIDDNKLDREIEKLAQDAFLSGQGVIRVKLDVDDDGEVVTNERFEFEAVSWRDFRRGPATGWENLPWEAFRHCVSREAAERYTDEDMWGAQVALPAFGDSPEKEEDIVFWEIWCKETRKVYFVREHDCKMMKIIDDPMELKGFFPNPPTVQPITLTGKMTPVCPFAVYKKLADELDTITKRINHIMKGLKVRALVAGNASKILEIANAGDNEIVVDADLEGLSQVGVDKAVLWWPVEQAVKVLKELYAQREVVKASIYEITGISDIVRGASQPSETATAQQIKTQWGALRIQKMQRMIERTVRDVFGIMAELIPSKFSEETLYKMTAVPITDSMRAMMSEPLFVSYRVDVESDSTVRADLTRQKADMTEFMGGTAQYFSTMAPLLETDPEAAGPVADLYASFASVFKLGRQGEDALERLKDLAKKAASKPRPNPEAEKAKAEMAMQQQEAQLRQQEAVLNAQIKMKEAEISQAEGQAKIQAEREKAQIGLQVAMVTLKLKEIELEMKQRESALTLHTKQAESAIKINSQREAAALKAKQAQTVQ